jgi:Spy/CpxP family protein refolding chaperone
MKSLSIWSLVVIFLTASWANAQGRTELPLRKYLFSPQILRNHQHELDLSNEQRQIIVQQINEAQAEFTSIQWNLESEIRTLAELVEDRNSEESKILNQLDVVLDLENEIKRKQLILGVRIRNVLNPEQLNKLQGIRARMEDDLRRRGGQVPRPNPNEFP